jgi:uncharacterized protein (DUF2235 family)
MKQIMWFSDGTGNDPKTGTNVNYLYELVKQAKDSKPNLHIVLGHDSGVGTLLRRFPPLRRLPAIFGLGFAAGFAKNIRDGYRFLMEHHEAGAEVYLFGFSRGAYTTRSLANFIQFCGGVIERTDRRLSRGLKIHFLYNLYRWRNFLPSKLLSRLLSWGQKEFKVTQCPIEVVGVWDTVASVGLPLPWNWYHLDGATYETKLTLHALALDERRQFYRPIRFVKNSSNQIATRIMRDSSGLLKIEQTELPDGQVLLEKWFPGVHSDIGGAYQDSKELPHVSLKWMLSEMPPHFPVKASAITTDHCLGVAHKTDHWYWLWCKDRSLKDGDLLHDSVQTRMSHLNYVPAAKLDNDSVDIALKTKRLSLCPNRFPV